MGKTITHELTIESRSIKTQAPLSPGFDTTIRLSFHPSQRDPMYGLKITTPHGRKFLVTRIRPARLEATIAYVAILYGHDGTGLYLVRMIRRLLKKGFTESTKTKRDRYH